MGCCQAKQCAIPLTFEDVAVQVSRYPLRNPDSNAYFICRNRAHQPATRVAIWGTEEMSFMSLSFAWRIVYNTEQIRYLSLVPFRFESRQGKAETKWYNNIHLTVRWAKTSMLRHKSEPQVFLILPDSVFEKRFGIPADSTLPRHGTKSKNTPNTDIACGVVFGSNFVHAMDEHLHPHNQDIPTFR